MKATFNELTESELLDIFSLMVFNPTIGYSKLSCIIINRLNKPDFENSKVRSLFEYNNYEKKKERADAVNWVIQKCLNHIMKGKPPQENININLDSLRNFLAADKSILEVLTKKHKSEGYFEAKYDDLPLLKAYNTTGKTLEGFKQENCEQYEETKDAMKARRGKKRVILRYYTQISYCPSPSPENIQNSNISTKLFSTQQAQNSTPSPELENQLSENDKDQNSMQIDTDDDSSVDYDDQNSISLDPDNTSIYTQNNHSSNSPDNDDEILSIASLPANHLSTVEENQLSENDKDQNSMQIDTDDDSSVDYDDDSISLDPDNTSIYTQNNHSSDSPDNDDEILSIASLPANHSSTVSITYTRQPEFREDSTWTNTSFLPNFDIEPKVEGTSDSFMQEQNGRDTHDPYQNFMQINTNSSMYNNPQVQWNSSSRSQDMLFNTDNSDSFDGTMYPPSIDTSNPLASSHPTSSQPLNIHLHFHSPTTIIIDKSGIRSYPYSSHMNNFSSEDLSYYTNINNPYGFFNTQNNDMNPTPLQESFDGEYNEFQTPYLAIW